MTTFAIATRDELWSHGRLLERRLTHGVAVHDGDAIDARDDRDDALVQACDGAMERLRAAMPRDARVRLVATARASSLSEVMVVARHGLSIVTTPEHVEADLRLLRPRGHAHCDELPILWRHGSAAVLLHEAAGHAAEHAHAPLSWPSWLSVHDEPEVPDDLGAPPRRVDLLAGECPASLRRESFRDVPIRRMTRLVVRASNAPFDLPAKRIEVHLLDGGTYEPLTELVTLRIASADFIDGDEVHALAPFVWKRSRAEVARSMRGARGGTLRYPGVVCSSEGQELVVESFAPELVTW